MKKSEKKIFDNYVQTRCNWEMFLKNSKLLELLKMIPSIILIIFMVQKSLEFFERILKAFKKFQKGSFTKTDFFHGSKNV